MLCSGSPGGSGSLSPGLLTTLCCSPGQALKLMMAAARGTERTQTNTRSKIYFFGLRMAGDDPKAVAVLEVRSTDCSGGQSTVHGPDATSLPYRSGSLATAALFLLLRGPVFAAPSR